MRFEGDTAYSGEDAGAARVLAGCMSGGCAWLWVLFGGDTACVLVGGAMTPEFYADSYRRYARYVRSYGASRPYKIACGSHDDYEEWTRVVMEKTCGERGSLLDGLSLHYYTVPGEWGHKGSAAEFTEADVGYAACPRLIAPG